MHVQELYWKAPDFRRARKRATWHSLTIFVAIGLGIVAFIESSIPFFIGIIIVEFFILIGSKRGRVITAEYRVDRVGLWYGSELVYRREEIVRFDIRDHGDALDVVPWCELILAVRGRRPNIRRMLIPHEKRKELRSYLIDAWQIQEFEYRIGAIGFLRRLLGL